MNNNPYGKLTLMMKKAAMTFKRVATASNGTITPSNGASMVGGAGMTTEVNTELVTTN